MSELRRQTARAMGVSLIAPLALLVAAALVAASGGGLGGLGSLGQIASGPSVPDSGLGSVPRASLSDPDLVTVSLGGGGAGATAPGAPAGTGDRGPGGGEVGLPPGSLGTPGTPGIRGTDPLVTERPPAPTPVTPPAAPPADDPVGDVVDTVRGVGEVVPAPLKPTTDGIVDSLLGPPR